MVSTGINELVYFDGSGPSNHCLFECKVGSVVLSQKINTGAIEDIHALEFHCAFMWRSEC